MKEIHYFITENRGELESLIGKIVGVDKPGSDFPDLKLFYGKHGSSYEFLKQIRTYDAHKGKICGSMNIIRTLITDDKFLYFNKRGVSGKQKFLEISQNDDGYHERQNFLKETGQWEEHTE